MELILLRSSDIYHLPSISNFDKLATLAFDFQEHFWIEDVPHQVLSYI